jgi:peptide/nickel transport system substrate-binding protein
MKNRQFWIILFILTLYSNFLFSACSNRQTKLVSQTNKETLKLLYWQAPTILNPHLSTGFKDAEASRITLEPLASYDKNDNLIPFLAAEIPTVANGGIAKDGKSVIWTLKKDVKWSDGTPFTAKDVVFTYQFVTNPKVGATTLGTYDVIKTVEAIDDYKVKITFKNPNPAWFLIFVGTEGMILPFHLYEKYNGANAREAPGNLKPVGTGPYRVVTFKPGDSVVYEASPYFRAKERLGFKRVELKGGGDATSAARAVLQTGDADYAYNLQVEANILQDLAKAGKGKVVAEDSPLVEQIIVNLTDPESSTPEGEKSSLKYPHPFLADKKVRQAISYAIDRPTISQQLYGATGKPTSNLVVEPTKYSSANTKYEFNLQKAAALLDEAGWKDTNNNGIRDKNGKEMAIVFQTSVNTLRQKNQQIIKQGLGSLGIKVELKSIDASVFFSSDPANNDTVEHFYADLQMFSTGNTNPDPGAYLKNFICKEIPQKVNKWSGNNYARYCNREYDGIWERANLELNADKRKELLIQMNDILVKEIIHIPLVHRADVVGLSNRIQNAEFTPWDLRTWKIMDWQAN